MDILEAFPRPSRPGPYKARSASDRTDDWPHWYIAGPNGTTNYLTDLGDVPGTRRGLPLFLPSDMAEAVADAWNAPPT